MKVRYVDPLTLQVVPMELTGSRGEYRLRSAPEAAGAREEFGAEALYLSPPWIDSHVHVFDGINFGLPPDDIGYRAGVHLLVDAGSAGAETYRAFRDHVVTPARTKVLAFLNISAVGLATLREYADMRQLQPEAVARVIQENPDLFRGVKVRSSGWIVEDKGLAPFRLAIEAAELAGCPVMVHMGEMPPTNEENLALFRKGDILTHCFHGKRRPQWEASPLWNPDGTPIPAMERAIARGVLLDVGHGEASFSAETAAPVLARGNIDFTISTDLHGLSWHDPVHSLAATMSKFLALGMPLPSVIRAVTALAAQRLGLDGWCDDPASNATLFRIRPLRETDPPFVDSRREAINVRRVIEPVAVLMDGEWIDL